MVFPPPNPTSAILVLDVAQQPRFVRTIGCPPLDALKKRAGWVADALGGSLRIKGYTVSTVRRDDWLLGFAFAPGNQAGCALHVTWSAPVLPALRIVLDDQCHVLSSSLPLGANQQDFQRAARQTEGEDFLWRGLWVEWQRLSAGTTRHWLVDLHPSQRSAEPAFARLTQRQREACALARLGLTTAETAKMLCCSHETARSHLKSAYRRLDIACRLELVEPAAEWERWTQLSL